jgi:hypothetical protein
LAQAYAWPPATLEGMERTVLRRILLATVMVAATTTMAVPAATASPATQHCPAGGVKVEAGDSPTTVSVTDTSTGDPIDVVVTITGSNVTFMSADADDTLVSASWCVKSGTKASPGTGTSGTSLSANKRGMLHDIGYVTLYNVSTSAPTEMTCYDSFLGFHDLQLTGAVDTALNGTVFVSTDGSCQGGLYQTVTVVAAPSGQAEADAKCAALGQGTGFGALSSQEIQYFGVPADWWFCTSFVQN